MQQFLHVPQGSYFTVALGSISQPVKTVKGRTQRNLLPTFSALSSLYFGPPSQQTIKLRNQLRMQCMAPQPREK